MLGATPAFFPAPLCCGRLQRLVRRPGYPAITHAISRECGIAVRSDVYIDLFVIWIKKGLWTNHRFVGYDDAATGHPELAGRRVEAVIHSGLPVIYVTRPYSNWRG